MCPRVQTADANFNDIKFSGDLLPRLSLYDTSGYSSQTLATSLVFKEHGPATMPPRFKSSCVCADHPGMVGLGGLEPPTSPLSGVRSNHLSYRPKSLGLNPGGASRDRTDDPLLAKQVLSQLSYGPM